ncbi:MAG: MarR family transcriptional regulator [Acidimicrobiia bacterium]|jgi:DNA-binding MarR family transcriptional regulator
MDIEREAFHAEIGLGPTHLHTKAAVSMLRVASLLSDELDRELQEASGLGLSEVLVILQIMFAGGQLKMADLADTVVVTRGGVTKIVDRLVAGGYLDRVPSAEDRRVIYARVTDAAAELIRTNQPVFARVTERRLASLLNPTELDTMHDLMHRLSCENPGWEMPQAMDGVE